MLESIFISHATPSDNYFTAWLSSKLKLLGYKVWVELDELKSGDAFWPEIEAAIRKSAIKFIAVISQAYLDKINLPSSGVFKELSCADRIGDRPNFRTPIKIDPIREDDFPVQLMGLNSIDFSENWQVGLDKLLDSFKRENIPNDKSKENNPLNFWLDSFNIESKINSSPETIYTNWFPFYLPDKLYINKPYVANKVDLIDIPYPYLTYSDRHITFFPSTDYPNSISCLSSVELDVSAILNEKLVWIDDSLLLNEPRKKIIELVNKCVEDFFFQSAGMRRYQLANSSAYYFPNNSTNSKRISLKEIGKTNVAIVGKTKDNYWSFGISIFTSLHPFQYIKVNSHIIFESIDQKLLDTDAQHVLRRKFGFDWYNKDWLDSLMGIMFKLSNSDQGKVIVIPVSKSSVLRVEAIPYSLITEFGFQEPSSIDSNEE